MPHDGAGSGPAHNTGFGDAGQRTWQRRIGPHNRRRRPPGWSDHAERSAPRRRLTPTDSVSAAPTPLLPVTDADHLLAREWEEDPVAPFATVGARPGQFRISAFGWVKAGFRSRGRGWLLPGALIRGQEAASFARHRSRPDHGRAAADLDPHARLGAKVQDPRIRLFEARVHVTDDQAIAITDVKERDGPRSRCACRLSSAAGRGHGRPARAGHQFGGTPLAGAARRPGRSRAHPDECGPNARRTRGGLYGFRRQTRHFRGLRLASAGPQVMACDVGDELRGQNLDPSMPGLTVPHRSAAWVCHDDGNHATAVHELE